MSGTIANISFALNSASDLYIGLDGNLAVVTGVDAVQQDCICAMSAQLGEIIYEPSSGMPYLTTVWLQTNLVQFEAAARATLLSVPGVTKVASFSATIVQVQNTSGGFDNVLNYAATLNTTYDQTINLNQSIVSGLNQ
jgi:hypothetical protein